MFLTYNLIIYILSGYNKNNPMYNDQTKKLKLLHPGLTFRIQCNNIELGYSKDRFSSDGALLLLTHSKSIGFL